MKSKRWGWTGRVEGRSSSGNIKVRWLDGILRDRDALVMASLLVLVSTCGAPAFAGDALEEFIEEQRIEEGDDVNAEPREDLGDAVGEEIEAQRCREYAEEIGLAPSAIDDWCDR